MEIKDIQFLISADTAITVQFGNEINENIHNNIMAFCMLLEQANIEGVIELVPTYTTVMIHYDPGVILFDEIVQLLKELIKHMHTINLPKGQVIEVPVCYGGKYGPDLEYVANYHGMHIDEVIQIHASSYYLIYMLGFTPGFAYMGGMDKCIATPRLTQPRTKIPAGSVGIAGGQTGIYPIDSPGGWQLIGQTPFILYDPKRQKPILFDAGQRIKFKPITEVEFEWMRAQNRN
ncbi:5-oxoprolinase subunit PxpB [Cellulosilyticum sp. I15G10I2]|uniref:5-oxoprolinase subunit PxpB n=1 Tax=Cellulosilyticum sp. I15G10I2 TaxID=1892843 RepID=UPI000A51E4B0|nr:5-oxoprolinase subunit PxpB [Cellulosilyticum sp. I15G10I2]